MVKCACTCMVRCPRKGKWPLALATIAGQYGRTEHLTALEGGTLLQVDTDALST